MPIPTPKEVETEREFVARAVSFIVKDDAHKDKPHDQIVAMAYSRWDEYRSIQFSIESFDSAVIFALEGLKPYEKIEAPEGMPTTIHDQPVAYFRKEALHCGSLVDTQGKTHKIDDSRIDKLVVNFNRAKSLGHRPHIPPRHKDAGDGSKNLGYVVDAEKRDGSLYVIEQRIGDDAIKAAARNGSSIGTLVNARLQNGEVIDEFFDHNCCTPSPQLGTKDKCSFSASRSKAVPVCLQFSRSSGDDMILTAEQLDKVKLLFGRDVPSDLTADNGYDRLYAHAEKIIDLNGKLAGKVQNLEKQSTVVPPTKNELFFAGQALENKREAVKAKAENLIRSGDGTKVVLDNLQKACVRKNPDIAGLTMSRSTQDGDQQLLDDISSSMDDLALCMNAMDSLKGSKIGVPAGGNRVAADPLMQLSGNGQDDDKKAIDDGIAEGKKYQDALLASRGLK